MCFIEQMLSSKVIFRETGEVWVELCPNNCRSAESLIPVIQKHVKPGTHIITVLVYISLVNYLRKLIGKQSNKKECRKAIFRSDM